MRVAVGAVWACAVVLWLACGAEVTPTPLLGTWYSEDARFADRSLEISPQWIRFMQGQKELGAVRIRSVRQEGSADGPLHFEFVGNDRDGQDTVLSFDFQRLPVELLRMETQREPWRRGPRFLDPGGTL